MALNEELEQLHNSTALLQVCARVLNIGNFVLGCYCVDSVSSTLFHLVIVFPRLPCMRRILGPEKCTMMLPHDSQ